MNQALRREQGALQSFVAFRSSAADLAFTG